MTEIFLVFTTHKERGYANASSLLEFLTCYQPDVIFLELPRYAFDWYYGLFYTRSSLESIAVRQYREKYTHVKLEPVDLAVPENFERGKEELFEGIGAASSDFGRLIDENTRDEREQGFLYLNSERCSQRWAEIYAVGAATLQAIDNPELTERFQSWIDTHERRDQAMIENIRWYCRDHCFEKGVFLMGAAHRQSIIDKAKAQVENNPTDITWRVNA